MKKIENGLRLFRENKRRLGMLFIVKFCNWLPDKPYLSLVYRCIFGKKLNWRNPLSYNEKINWLKVYDHNPLYTQLVDKYAVKNYVAEKIGSEYIIPTLAVWDMPEQIDWDSLPNQFVLKTTHGGGGDGVVICRDKSSFDKAKAIAKLNNAMKTSPYKRLREWPYKHVKHRILAEQYMEDASTKELRDYKFFAFDGEVKALFIATDRQNGGVKFDYFDADFNHLDLVQEHPMSGKQIRKPVAFEEMKRLAGLLSKGLKQVRCDFYEVNGKVYFGELTFSHHGGITPFHPESWDYTFGKWIDLSVMNIE